MVKGSMFLVWCAKWYFGTFVNYRKSTRKGIKKALQNAKLLKN